MISFENFANRSRFSKFSFEAIFLIKISNVWAGSFNCSEVIKFIFSVCLQIEFAPPSLIKF
jgi:hypothetical protein